MTTPPISIIIPVLNEADNLRQLLPYLRAQFPPSTELIVVDGGSIDDGKRITEVGGGQWHQARRGRASQMNAGAQIAKGEYLYFLHADTRPPADLYDWMQRLDAEQIPAACCRLRFDENAFIYRLLSWFTRFDLNCFRFGDQGLLVHRTLFFRVSGFDENRRILEDNDIVVRLKRIAPFRVLPVHVVTSARKYRQHGAIYLQLVFILLYGMDRLGGSQRALSAVYQRALK